ncbi:orotidine-5'-phosphate decarboxylase [candidate division KSB1 bacterium]|nr:orotidine-5'-phosphate decarboxylase [candidate division KSB1 bacterium]
MKSLNETIRKTIQDRNSLVCVGLDYHSDKVPLHIKEQSDPIFTFNKAIINATADLVCAYKPNLAFYEAYGAEGWDALERTVHYIPEGIIKIGDAKRGDIGSTAAKYADALFQIGFDVVTVNPYLGIDSITPFIKDPTRGVFILCLTSNPSSKDFQYLDIDGLPLHLHVAQKVNTWNDNDNCGLVVGATHPDELRSIRQMTPNLPFLIPGIGAQGGDLESSIKMGTDAKNSMAIINSSRGILFASSGLDFKEAAREEAQKLRDQINTFRERATSS